ncbi:MAG: alkylhydroperoxidase [Bacteroidetes bacterium]|nr:alkylhydroperoxidase [Bacteroidota bacterium]
MMEETRKDLFNDLHIEGDNSSRTIKQLVAGNCKYIRDLRMNLKGIYKSKVLSAKEVSLLALAIATTNKNETLRNTYTVKAREFESSDAEIAEAMACASLLSSNNVLYRFRHYVGKESYEAMRAGIRMNIMMSPVTGKEFFELMSLAVSAVNGCEMCVKSHEASVLKAGGSEERIWDAVRIASIITSADRMI